MAPKTYRINRVLQAFCISICDYRVFQKDKILLEIGENSGKYRLSCFSMILNTVT